MQAAALVLVVVFGVFVGGVFAEPVASPERNARTLEAPEAFPAFSFAIFGDRVPGPSRRMDRLSQAVETANRLGVAFVFTTGNMIDGASDEGSWAADAQAYRTVMDELDAPWYPVRGERDATRITPGGTAATSIERADRLYASSFGPSTYAFSYESVQFVVLRSSEIRARSAGRDATLGWLAETLRESGSEQVVVVLHEPLWREAPDQWQGVHDLLARSGKPVRVFSGGTGYARDDGERDGVKYGSVGVTGAFGSETHEYAASDSITLVRVTADDHSVAIVPHDIVKPHGAYPARDADAIHALATSGWASIEGFLHAGEAPGDGAAFEAVLENPTLRRVRYTVEAVVPSGWVLSQSRISGVLEPGQTLALPFSADAPALESDQPLVEVVVAARYPLETGEEQPVVRRLTVPIRPRGADSAAAALEVNGVLSLAGRGAVRVDLGERPWSMTLEAWVQGRAPSGNEAVVSRFVRGAGAGLSWSRTGGVLPSARIGTDRGTAIVGLGEPLDWDAWHHLAVTYDGRDATLFVDGVAVSRSSGGALAFGSGALFIGAEPSERGDPSASFSGLIDEVRVSSVVRYTENFVPARVHERDADTLLLLHFDIPFGAAHPDDSGRGHHGWTVGEADIIKLDRP